MEADALSTTFYTLSVEEGIALADTLDHVCVIYVTKDFRVFFSQGAEAIFELTDPDFILSSIEK
jgi:thiamine biosynthesis lipoprotein